MDVHDQQQLKKSRVVRMNSEELWDFFITQAANQGCPVSLYFVFVYVNLIPYHILVLKKLSVNNLYCSQFETEFGKMELGVICLT